VRTCPWSGWVPVKGGPRGCASTAAPSRRSSRSAPGEVAIFDVPQRFSQKWVHDKVPTMDSTEFHAMFHEAATRGWDEDELASSRGCGRAAGLTRRPADGADDSRRAPLLVGRNRRRTLRSWQGELRLA
jgi:hypothetical protein